MRASILMGAVAAVAVGAGLGAPAASGIGSSPDAFFAPEWAPDATALLIHARAPQTEVRRLALAGPTERVADVTTPAHLSSRGELAYVSRASFAVGALTVRDTAGRTRVVAQAFSHGGVSWSPHGDQIAFRAANGRLAVVGRDGTGRREFPHTAWDPAWSPDGNLIAYVDGRETRVVDVRTGAATVVGPAALGFDAPVVFQTPSSVWSPDSSRLALSLNPGVHIVGAEGAADAVRIPAALFPSWSPDGDELAVQLQDDIVVVGADGSGARAVVASEMPELQPAWSPDGRWIAYTNQNVSPPGQAYQAGHATDVLVVRPNGTDRRSLTGGCGLSPETPLDWLCVMNGRWSIPFTAARAPRVAIATDPYARAIKIPVHVSDRGRYVYGARVTIRQVSGPRVRVTTMSRKPPSLLSDTGGRAAFRFLKPSRHGTVVLRVSAAGTTRLMSIRV